ncbi:hypothetical protein PGTUg99_000076 [Puccinia graminis f. sp. tritici]|nr:hypothetical protein PGTUg99_000076 [Puccinia graminis f. sp. tritici]
MLFAALSAASGAFASPAQAAGSTTATKDLFVGAHVTTTTLTVVTLTAATLTVNNTTNGKHLVFGGLWPGILACHIILIINIFKPRVVITT